MKEYMLAEDTGVFFPNRKNAIILKGTKLKKYGSGKSYRVVDGEFENEEIVLNDFQVEKIK